MTLARLTAGRHVIACVWLLRDTMHMQHQCRPSSRHGEETTTSVLSPLSGEYSIRPVHSKCLGTTPPRPHIHPSTKYLRRPGLGPEFSLSTAPSMSMVDLLIHKAASPVELLGGIPIPQGAGPFHWRQRSSTLSGLRKLH